MKCLRLGLAVAVVLALGAAGATARAGNPSAPHVLVIGDSVATGMQWYPDAVAVLERGLEVEWQVAVCRRLVGVSCTFQGDTPPNLVGLVGSLGAVPPVVIVEMGYNDFAATFAASVEQSINALLQHGARQILWLTLRAVKHPYVDMNAALAAAARRHPQLRLVDWNVYARSHPDWFQSDGEHLVESGGVAMATLVHLAVDEVVNPLLITCSTVAPARLGTPYAARLTASGGRKPYRWRLDGSPPAGLHLLADGRMYGTPRRLQRVTLKVHVTDAEGQTAARRLPLVVSPTP